MNAFRRFYENRPYCFWMLAFVVAFYLAAFFVSLATPKQETEKTIKEKIHLKVQGIKEKEEAFKKNVRKNPKLFSAITLSFLLMLCLGLSVNFYLLMRRLGGQPVMPRTPPPAAAPWGLADIFEVFVFLFFVEAAVVSLTLAIGLLVDLRRANKDVILFINNLVRNTALLIFLFFTVKIRFHRSLSEIGLHGRRLWKNILTGILGYLAAIPPLFLILLALTFFAGLFSYEPPPQPVVEIYLKASSDRHLLFFTFFVAVAGPFAEEIFFRGFIYGALRKKWGVRLGMIASAALFGALHMNFFIFIPIFFLGIFLAVLYEKTGSLVPSITAHVVHNLIMVVFTLVFKTLSA